MSKSDVFATNNDLEDIINLLRAFYNESLYRVIEPSEPKFRLFLSNAIKSDNFCCLIERSSSGLIDGIFIGHCDEFYFSKQKGAWDLIFYVRPDRRGSLCASRLLRGYRRWAAAKNAKMVWLGTSTGIGTEIAKRFFKGSGFKEAGALFVIDL